MGRSPRRPGAPAHRSTRRWPGPLELALAAGLCILAVQLGVLAWHSWRQYQQFDLSLDYGIFHQSWSQIAHGHLDPLITVNPAVAHPPPYWRSHFELIMWPLAGLYWLWPNDGLTLLALQDLSIVGAEAVTLWWIRRMAERRSAPVWLGTSSILGAAVLGAANPWLYSGAQQDFHFEAVAGCFALGAAYALWIGRGRWCAALAVLTACCGDVSATYLVGVGICMLIAAPQVRRRALAVGGFGLGWVAVAAALGANQGSPISDYAYLAGHPVTRGVGGIAAVVKGVVLHPSSPLHRLYRSRHAVLRLLQPSGVIGVLSPETWAVVVLVVVENVFDDNRVFQMPEFQNFPLYLFATAGTGLLVVAVGSGNGRRRAFGCVVLAGCLASSLTFDVGRHEYGVFRTSVPAGIELAAIRARVPADAEVISSFGVLGRFAGRRSIHTFLGGSAAIPIDAPVVVLVLAPGIGNDPAAASLTESLRRIAVDRFHAALIGSGAGVAAYQWRSTVTPATLSVP